MVTAVMHKKQVDMSQFGTALMARVKGVWQIEVSDPRGVEVDQRKRVVYDSWMGVDWTLDQRPPLPRYLGISLPSEVMRNMSRFRVSSHCCKVGTGRYERPRVAWSDRKCDRCDMGRVQDELHVLMECPAT